MLQCTSEIEKAQPGLWPTLNNKKAGATTVLTIADTVPYSGTRATKDKAKLSKMDKHFPNLLDTIEIEAEDEAASSVSQCRLNQGVLPSKSAAGPKGNNIAASSKRTPKKQQLLLFSTDMNFNRN